MILNRVGYSTPQKNTFQKNTTFIKQCLEPIDVNDSIKHKSKITLKRIAIIACIGAANLGILGVAEVVKKGSSFLAEKYNAMDKAFLEIIAKDIPR